MTWTVKDTLLWFQYIVAISRIDNNNSYEHELHDNQLPNQHGIGLEAKHDSYHSDYTIDDLSDSDDTDEGSLSTTIYEDNKRIDWNVIEAKMEAFGFRAKKNLPNMNNDYIFKQFGFNNKNDCKFLCKKTKELLTKYPKFNPKSGRKSKKYDKSNNHKQNLSPQVEGMLEDTH